MTRVIVIVEGGCVQAVQADDPDIEVTIVDYDCQEENLNLKRTDGSTASADVWQAIVDPITLDI